MVSSILISGVVRSRRAIVGWTVLPVVSLFLNLEEPVVGVFVGKRGEEEDPLFFSFSMFFKNDLSYFNRFLSESKRGMRNNKAWIFFLIGTLWKISFARFAATSIKFLFLLF